MNNMINFVKENLSKTISIKADEQKEKEKKLTKPTVKKVKASETSTEKLKGINYVTGRMWWLRAIFFAARFFHRKNIYTEIARELVYTKSHRTVFDVRTHETLSALEDICIERNVIKIYFDRRNKAQLDQAAASHGIDQFYWFGKRRMPDITITDFGVRGRRNEVAVKDPNDFFKYAHYAVDHSYMVKYRRKENVIYEKRDNNKN